MYTQDPTKILDAAAANGIGRPLFVGNAQDVYLALHGGGLAGGTVRFQISYQKAMPNFAAGQSAANSWDYARVTDLEDGASIDGDTGIVFAGADDNRNFVLDANGAQWINAIISGYSAGAFDLTATPKSETI